MPYSEVIRDKILLNLFGILQPPLPPHTPFPMAVFWAGADVNLATDGGISVIHKACSAKKNSAEMLRKRFVFVWR
jgi:hypothetical protein